LLATISTVVASIVIFSLMVFSHEFGHFITAKKAGVKVEEFSIGMGPKIVSWRRGDTGYSLRAFPIGGYVKMLGEDGYAEGEGSFHNKSVGKRLGILMAGPVMNILLAIVLFSIIFFALGTPTTVVDSVMKDYPAQAAGIRPGDRVVEINDVRVNSWDRLQSVISTFEGERMKVLVSRDREMLSFSVAPITDDQTGQRVIGITPRFEKSIIAAVRTGVTRSFSVIWLMVTYLSDLVTGSASPGEVVGAVGIVQLVNEAAKTGILNLMFLAAFLSLNLGVINLLPIPALDGGRIVFLLIEGLRGRPIDIEKEGLIHFIGFVFLILLIIVVTWNDISKINLF